MAEQFEETLGAEIGNIIREQLQPLRRENAELRRENAELQKRVETLETRPPLKYCGTWEAGRTYLENSLVTKGGSLWIAKRTTAAYPGGGAEPDSWQLCVKRGADGKDAVAGKDAR